MTTSSSAGQGVLQLIVCASSQPIAHYAAVYSSYTVLYVMSVGAKLPTAARYDVVLLDIEGTTTPIGHCSAPRILHHSTQSQQAPRVAAHLVLVCLLLCVRQPSCTMFCSPTARPIWRRTSPATTTRSRRERTSERSSACPVRTSRKGSVAPHPFVQHSLPPTTPLGMHTVRFSAADGWRCAAVCWDGALMCAALLRVPGAIV